MKSKPIKFGFKLWSVCGHDGYPYHMERYTGKSEEKFVFGFGGDVVQKMINTVIEIDEGNLKKSEVFFDNYFTGYDLMKNLASRDIFVTGTVRANRTKEESKKIGVGVSVCLSVFIYITTSVLLETLLLIIL